MFGLWASRSPSHPLRHVETNHLNKGHDVSNSYRQGDRRTHLAPTQWLYKEEEREEPEEEAQPLAHLIHKRAKEEHLSASASEISHKQKAPRPTM